MAARCARAAIRYAGDWVHERPFAGRFCSSHRRVPPRLGRGGLRRRPERRDRVSLGPWSIRPPASARGRTRGPPGRRARGGRWRSFARAAKQATATIPIIFGIGGDPIKAGLVESLNRPGGNATGYTLLTDQMEPKRLGLLHELVPGASLIGALLNPNFLPTTVQLQELEEAARTIGQRLFVARSSADYRCVRALKSAA